MKRNNKCILLSQRSQFQEAKILYKLALEEPKLKKIVKRLLVAKRFVGRGEIGGAQKCLGAVRLFCCTIKSL